MTLTTKRVPPAPLRIRADADVSIILFYR